MTDEKREALRAKAEKATRGPYYGPRVTDLWPPGWVGIYAGTINDEGVVEPVPHDIMGVTGRYDEEQAMADAAFFAEADASTVLELLEEVKEARATARLLREALIGAGAQQSFVDGLPAWIEVS